MSADAIEALRGPTVGLGTGRLEPPAACTEAVRRAIEMGYRLVDAAERYGNEAHVGAGIAAASVPREAVTLATKVLHPECAETADPESMVTAARGCLERLGVESVDLLYFHWPDDYDLEAAFEGFDRLYDEGVYDHLGVCNFTPELLDGAMDLTGRPIEVVQAEMNPLRPNRELRAYCAENDLAFVGFAPLMRGRIGEVEEVVEVAEKHATSPQRVSLAWIASKGVASIPKATSEAHLRENLGAPAFELDDADLARIDGIERRDRVADPPHAPW